MILDRLGTLAPLTPAEESLVSYIAEHPTEVVRTPIAELAARTATSNATIIRFCKRMGFNGFRSFRIQLVTEIERGLGGERSLDLNFPIAPQQSTAEALTNIADLTKEAIDACHAALDIRDIQAVARLIHRSSVVFLYATGDSQISSEAFANLLIKLGIRCIIAERRREYPANAHAVRPNDLAIFTSYSGDHIDSMIKVGVLQELRRRRCPTIAITASPEPQPWFDRTITFPAREHTEDKMATFYSQTCIRYIFNCLYAEVWSLDYAGSALHKSTVETAAASAKSQTPMP